MKKYLSLLLITFLSIALNSCNQQEPENSPNPKSSCGCGETCPCLEAR